MLLLIDQGLTECVALSEVTALSTKAVSLQQELEETKKKLSQQSTVRSRTPQPLGDNANASVVQLRTQLQEAQNDRRALREALNLFDDDDGATIVSILKKLNNDIDSWAADLAGTLTDAMSFGKGLTIGKIVQHPRFSGVFVQGEKIVARLGSDSREDDGAILAFVYYALCALATQVLLQRIFVPFHPSLYSSESVPAISIGLDVLSKRVQVSCELLSRVPK